MARTRCFMGSLVLIHLVLFTFLATLKPAATGKLNKKTTKYAMEVTIFSNIRSKSLANLLKL